MVFVLRSRAWLPEPLCTLAICYVYSTNIKQLARTHAFKMNSVDLSLCQQVISQAFAVLTPEKKKLEIPCLIFQEDIRYHVTFTLQVLDINENCSITTCNFLTLFFPEIYAIHNKSTSAF